MVLRLRLCASNAGVTGSIPGGETKITHTVKSKNKTKQNKTHKAKATNLQGNNFSEAGAWASFQF